MIHKRLQKLIDHLGWNQARLAKAVVTNPSTVSRWFSGEMPPSKNSIRRIANATGANREWIETGHGPMLIESAKENTSSDEKASAGGGINITEGVLMTELVLGSGMPYADALWSNLKSFAQAVREKRKVDELMKKMLEMEAMMKKVLENQTKQEQATEKRDPAANA